MRRYTLVWPAVLLLDFVSACNPGNGAHPRASSAANDSAFAEVQKRGYVAMGVDQYSSTHHFEPLPDGGRITLTRNSADPAGVRQIRSHMADIATAFEQGNFAIPGFVHDRAVPGTAVMAARRNRISYHADTVPLGGSLRIQTTDSAALAAIHQFLAFQQRDHRSPHAQSH